MRPNATSRWINPTLPRLRGRICMEEMEHCTFSGACLSSLKLDRSAFCFYRSRILSQALAFQRGPEAWGCYSLLPVGGSPNPLSSSTRWLLSRLKIRNDVSLIPCEGGEFKLIKGREAGREIQARREEDGAAFCSEGFPPPRTPSPSAQKEGTLQRGAKPVTRKASGGFLYSWFFKKLKADAGRRGQVVTASIGHCWVFFLFLTGSLTFWLSFLSYKSLSVRPFQVLIPTPSPQLRKPTYICSPVGITRLLTRCGVNLRGLLFCFSHLSSLPF